jgi:hypothetical protein
MDPAGLPVRLVERFSCRIRSRSMSCESHQRRDLLEASRLSFLGSVQRLPALDTARVREVAVKAMLAVACHTRVSCLAEHAGNAPSSRLELLKCHAVDCM